MFDWVQDALKRVREWNDRRVAIMTLSSMNDYQLADIGIERGAVVDAVKGRLRRYEAARG